MSATASDDWIDEDEREPTSALEMAHLVMRLANQASRMALKCQDEILRLEKERDAEQDRRLETERELFRLQTEKEVGDRAAQEVAATLTAQVDAWRARAEAPPAPPDLEDDQHDEDE